MRSYLVEGVEASNGKGTLVHAACLDDDAQGQLLDILWELESRFGLVFEVLDREYVDRVRREYGFATNPWTTFPRFVVSHNLLVDEGYAGSLRAWLDNLRPGSLLILDEAHHAAPASGSKY